MPASRGPRLERINYMARGVSHFQLGRCAYFRRTARCLVAAPPRSSRKRSAGEHCYRRLKFLTDDLRAGIYLLIDGKTAKHLRCAIQLENEGHFLGLR